MPRIPAIRIALGTLALLLTAGAARAQDIPSPYRFIEKGQEAGLITGYYNLDRGRFGFGPESGFAIGARYGFEVGGPVALEATAISIPTTRSVVNPARIEGDRVVETADVALVTLEARLRFALTGRRTWNGLNPFIFLGAGLGFDAQGDQSEDQVIGAEDRFDFGTKFLGSAGAGTRIFLTNRLAARVEGGLLLYQLGTPSGYSNPDRNLDLGEVPEDEWVSGTHLSIGLSFLF